MIYKFHWRRIRAWSCILLVLVLVLVGAHRLPAPISEIPEKPTPTPAQFIRAKSKPPSNSTEKSSTIKKPATMAEAQEVRVVISEEAHSALQYLKNYAETYEHMPFTGKSDVQPNEIIERLQQVLSNRFRRVSIASDGSAARAGKTGLVMVFDLQAHVGMMSFQKNTVSFSGTFKDESGKPIQTITAAGSSTVPYPNFNTQFPKALSKAFADFSQKLNALR